MPEKLFESDFITVDLSAYTSAPAASSSSAASSSAAASGGSAGSSNPATTFIEEPPTTYNGTWWKKELERRLNANAAAAKRQSPDQIEETFFKDFFIKNWPEDIATKLATFGSPLRKVFKVLGFDRAKNPILGFIKQSYVQKNLIQTGLLNVNTFKVIYNAVSKHLTSDIEFYKANKYNLIYCKLLYSKSPTEMQEYLEQQKLILDPDEPTDADKQLSNRRVFLKIPGIKEVNPVQRAKIINSDTYKDESKVPTITNAKELNSLALAKAINGNTEKTIHRSANELAIIAQKLTTLADKFAAILSLSISTKSKAAKAALSVPEFASLDGAQITKAFTRLSTGDIMPRGQLTATDADALVNLILSSMKKDGSGAGSDTPPESTK